MMFQFANEGKVWWRVNLVARDAEGGDPTDVPVFLLYRIYTRKELKERERKLKAPMAKLGQSKDEASMMSILREVEALDDKNAAELVERVHDWRDIGDGKGDPLKFSRERLKALLDDEAQYARISAGLLEASKGARAKNSSPGLAGSRAPEPN
jgi:hypothetical protein